MAQSMRIIRHVTCTRNLTKKFFLMGINMLLAILIFRICLSYTCIHHKSLGFHEQIVAIKQLNHDGIQGFKKFLVEVLMLSLLHHSNLVTLIGYCTDGDQRLLVYEYMPMGCLEDHLFGKYPVLCVRMRACVCVCVGGGFF